MAIFLWSIFFTISYTHIFFIVTTTYQLSRLVLHAYPTWTPFYLITDTPTPLSHFTVLEILVWIIWLLSYWFFHVFWDALFFQKALQFTDIVLRSLRCLGWVHMTYVNVTSYRLTGPGLIDRLSDSQNLRAIAKLSSMPGRLWGH